ncbi:nucleotidyltransferase family protein [uncultured Eubacterium sp.]|uniref:nucleotidyltransferase domain-containing protein n=1 Tax=uncultured Eubacterium sp. TaxID=165185 RepID=UPI0025DA46DE|nr:nucleotidyltransferase family protein [uncultured Eubacterium sp.]
MIVTDNSEQNCLLKLLRCVLKDEPFVPDKDINTAELLKLAVNQQVYTTVLPCLEQSGILTDKEKEKWNNYKLSEIQKNLIISSEREALCRNFDDAGIRYMFMKGLVIRNYYPQTFMRQMSDNDILYGVEKRDELFEVMKKNGFYLSAFHSASDDFFKAPYVLMEMHKTLFDDNCEVKLDLDLWKRAIKCEGNNSRYNMSPDDNYIYSLAHMCKHYSGGGCGIRFVCDMYLLHYSNDKLDFEYINSQFKKFGLYEFYQKVMRLVEAIFNDAEYNDEDLQLLNEVFAGGVYGVIKSLDETIEESGGKFNYLFRKIFPKKEFMYRNYEYLQNKPYLLFPTYIKHFVLRYKNKGKDAKKTLKKVLKN